MLKVGLTGGLASGKTFVAGRLEQHGCFVLHADELGHRVLDPGGGIYDAVVAEFGRRILREDGTIDRRKLASEVFPYADRLAALNRLVHPAVFDLEGRQMAEYAAREPRGIAVVEAAIMIETGSFKRFHRLIVAVCGEEEQIRRAIKRDGISREEALARMSHQMPLAEKRKYADFIVDTSGSKEDTGRQVDAVYTSLRSLQA
ncbi:MAG: dephospho-CoA kinase [Bryobacteraceae bacterium]